MMAGLRPVTLGWEVPSGHDKAIRGASEIPHFWRRLGAVAEDLDDTVD